MSFQQSISGLNAAARSLDVIGNNVANANTVGAKASRTEFADVYATSLSGASNSSPGIGVTVGAIDQMFTQGEIATTNNPTDMAINGAGFFRLSNQGAIEYSRNGQFKQDKDGYIVNMQGRRLTGYPADDNGLINGGTASELKIRTADLTPRASTAGRLTMNLDARATVPTVAFNGADPRTFSGSTTLTVFDSLGRDHAAALYFRKTGVNTWEVNATADGTALAGNPVATLAFSTAGTLSSGAPFTLNIPVGVDAGGSLAMTVQAPDVTQFGSTFGVTELTQNGFTSGRLSGFSLSDEGVILSRYSNGQSQSQGQIALGNFANPQGLKSLGGNAWAESPSSGQALVGKAASGNLGLLQSGAVENSNVDLTSELVNMITAQRYYQANAQTIKTQDQVLQTLVNMR